jgi:Flp pilus assembly protein TadD
VTIGRFLVLAVIAIATWYYGVKLARWYSLPRRALRKAKRGDLDRAMSDLRAMIAKRKSLPAAHGALGQVLLMAGRPEEAEAELRTALELGSLDVTHLGALGWALVRQGRFDEAVPLAEEANERAHEDFEVYCLYCGLMARHGRAVEVVQLYDFLKRTDVQIRKQRPSDYDKGLSEKFEFVRSAMNVAGFT